MEARISSHKTENLCNRPGPLAGAVLAYGYKNPRLENQSGILALQLWVRDEKTSGMLRRVGVIALRFIGRRLFRRCRLVSGGAVVRRRVRRGLCLSLCRSRCCLGLRLGGTLGLLRLVRGGTLGLKLRVLLGQPHPPAPLAQRGGLFLGHRSGCHRLFQLADYICTLELTALKYQAHADTATDRLFFGQWGSFKKNYLRKLRKHRLG